MSFVVSANRITSIDLLRGFAITIMVVSHTIIFLLAGVQPIWFIFYEALAAPIFICVVGIMVAISSRRSKHTLKYYLIRGLMVVGAGVFVDIAIWQIYPFTSFDVLYLIGLAIPAAYLFLKLNRVIQLTIIFSVFFLTPFLQVLFGYINPIGLLNLEKVSEYSEVLSRWLINGWFPVFPWIVFAFVGAVFGDLRYRLNNKFFLKNKNVAISSLAVIGLGSIIMFFSPGTPLALTSYSIGFIYPPTIGFSVVAVGIVGVLFIVMENVSTVRILKPLAIFGSMALFFYILHLALLEYVLSLLGAIHSFTVTLLICSVFLGFLLLVAYGLYKMKQRLNWGTKPWILKFIFGG
jgi:uncharacterized membrane protein